MAASLIKEHDDLVASGQRPHRVTSFLVGPEEGSLRRDMEEHAAGHGMSDRLRCEVCAYQLCKVDDTWAEAVHRDVSGFGKRATAAKVPYIAAAHRLGQTMASVDKMSPSELSQFHDCMRRYKAIGQKKPGRAKKLRSLHKTVAQLEGQVYRCDSSACRDWGAELGSAMKLLDDRPAKNRSIAERLQIEYLDSAIADGEVLSLPELSQAVAAPDTLAGPIVQQQRPASAETFFVIVDKAAARKKQLRTAAMAAQRAMVKPVSLQRMTVWPGGPEDVGAGAGGHETLVYHDGFPQIVDMLSLAPWPAWRGALRQWQTIQSQVVGCLAIAAPQPVVAHSDWQLDRTPTLCLLDELASQGWVRGKAPEEHTLVSSKTFAVKDPIASKGYLRCLLGLERLVCDGKLPALRSDQPNLYYMCVLASEQPQLVLCGQSPAQYKRILDVQPSADLFALGDSEQPPNPASPAGSSDSVELCVPMDHGQPKRAPSGRGRGRGRGVGGSRTRSLEEDWGALVWAPPPDAQPSVAQAVGQSQSSAGPADGSGAASSSSVGQPIAASTLVAVEPGEQRARSIQEVRCKAMLEGVVLHEEAHGVIGQPGSYRRLVVRCPHHKSCRKTRSFGVRRVAQSGLGDIEPYAFLGCWLSAHSRLEASAHKHFAPTMAEVVAYADEHGLAPQPDGGPM